jgi:hypothetical protein
MLGYAALDETRIAEGVRLLARAARKTQENRPHPRLLSTMAERGDG